VPLLKKMLADEPDPV